MSGFPSLPPPVYRPSKQVSLLDCKTLASREAEHKKWMDDRQASSFPVPIGMRPIDLEDDLGMDLDEDEASFGVPSLDEESVQDEEPSLPESESIPAEDDEAWRFLDPTSDEEEQEEEEEEEGEETGDEPSVQSQD